MSEELIQQVALQLGTSVQHVYEVMVAAQPIKGAISLIVTGLWLGLSAIVLKKLYDKKAYIVKTCEEMPEIDIVLIFSVISLLIIIFVVALIMSAAATKILLPEYSAIMEIINIIGGTIK